MTDRIQSLVKRIAETRPVQSARRQALLGELRELRRELDERKAPDQAHCLDAALLLMEFMARSEDVATAETLHIVAGLVGTIDGKSLRTAQPQGREHAPAPPPAPVTTAHADVTQHRDLCLTQEFLLGSILLQAGVITTDSLGRALQLHTSSGLALGQCLVQLGAATPEQIASAVAFQDRLREEERHWRSESEASRPAPAAAAAATHSPARHNDLRLSSKQKGYVQSMHAQVLGEVLIRLGTITREQLEHALQVQRAASVHIGEALVETGAASWDQVKRALDVQRQLRRGAA